MQRNAPVACAAGAESFYSEQYHYWNIASVSFPFTVLNTARLSNPFSRRTHPQRHVRNFRQCFRLCRGQGLIPVCCAAVRQITADFNPAPCIFHKIHRGIVFRMIQVQGDVNFPEFALPGQEVQFDGRAGSADRQPKESSGHRKVPILSGSLSGLAQAIRGRSCVPAVSVYLSIEFTASI